MKEQKELIKKVKIFLDSRKIYYNNDSLEYIGVKENYEIEDGNPQNYHFISYEVIIDKTNKYSIKTYFIYIDKENFKISYIIGPQSFEKIEE